ncbi:MAG: hypothetical protein ACK5JS_09640 [Mangrovibacterium sp.]
MKKLLLIAVALIGFTAVNAQEVGIRFGDSAGNNVAVDAVFGLGQFSRIHADVNFGYGVGIDALWDCLYRPIGGAEGLNWYAGFGPSLHFGDNWFGLGVSGEVGMEYRFKFPLAIGLDYRPTFWILEDTDFNWGGFGLNLRYVF